PRAGPGDRGARRSRPRPRAEAGEDLAARLLDGDGAHHGHDRRVGPDLIAVEADDVVARQPAHRLAGPPGGALVRVSREDQPGERARSDGLRALLGALDARLD